MEILQTGIINCKKTQNNCFEKRIFNIIPHNSITYSRLIALFCLETIISSFLATAIFICKIFIRLYQGLIKQRVGPGPDVHSGPYSKSFKNLNIFDELKYIVWTYKPVLVDHASFESF